MSRKYEADFVTQCLRGDALLDEIDTFVQYWHEHNTNVDLPNFLGMSEVEYMLWVTDAAVLPFIVTARKEGRDIETLLEEWQALPLAARADSPGKAIALMKWLRETGKLK